jgi:hypothetical protein
MSLPVASTATAPGVQPVPTAPDMPPTLFVIVDTEEEFDWGKPFDRNSTGVTAMAKIDRLQSILDRHRIRPTYVIDYCVSHQRDGHALLKAFADEGRCQIGAHLHPWVTPPHAEAVNRTNSFGCRLDPTLEAEKIRVLRDDIAEHVGRMPTVFKAGRYGFGPTTAAALEALDFDIDVSVNPRMNYIPEGGPSFDDFDTTPFFFGRHRRLLEIPCSTDYTGITAGTVAPALHRAVSVPALRPFRAVGIAARLGLVNKIMLSPETSSLGEMQALTRSLASRGVRTFSFTLHSPSVQPGCTPYVRSQRDLDEFLARIDAYCGFFLGEMGGVASTPEDFRRTLMPPGLHTSAEERRS